MSAAGLHAAPACLHCTHVRASMHALVLPSPAFGVYCSTLTPRPLHCCFPPCAHLPQATGANTFFGKTATMIQSVGGIGHLQMILMKIMVVLVVLSLVLCIICLIYLCTYGDEPFGEALEFVVVLLVASIPIAIEIVCTATLALGSRQLSSHGAIVTR